MTKTIKYSIIVLPYAINRFQARIFVGLVFYCFLQVQVYYIRNFGESQAKLSKITNIGIFTNPDGAKLCRKEKPPNCGKGWLVLWVCLIFLRSHSEER